ncbi:aminopeptidase P family protein [Wolbachia endosymbiont of Dirofilaria (Dirofilaria) immitis]|uniref:aminopeptidase P family protein n=1 Tax=Wolbachia endosymbiont of Dirofilaria (Dirofilaria) immitis TaxID=1812115 RepID=UPI001588A1B2|nr:aminopeptidase P family protein [Wolbachia endosymbiont of Dirofilaria (Dirofilaria) immitis]QKX02421.1 M24 family metallopeptidase [Wolbachia endosymbiont of Dirofilaria (Dirofilaria) immitis]
MLKIEKFRSFMRKINVDMFILHTKDEYLNEYSDELTKLCGFTGTNGLLIVTKNNKCPFFTDERYIIQAYNQLNQNTFQVYNTQEENPYEWAKANLTLTTSLGYHPQSFTIKEIKKYENICRLVPYPIKKKSNHKKQIIVSHAAKYSGESSKSKCERVTKSIDKEIEAVLLTDPSSISWLLNLRNENAKHTPCILGRVILYKSGNVDLFIQGKEYSTIQANLDNHINIFDTSKLESSLRRLSSVMIDPSTTPMSIMAIIQSKRVVEREDPCLIHKAVKNQTEIAGAINAHIRDGVAVTNFLYWLENNVNKSLANSHIIQITNTKTKKKNADSSITCWNDTKRNTNFLPEQPLYDRPSEITELKAEEKLLEHRKEQALFKQLSFPTISAFNENGAIIHYRASNETNKIIQKDGLYLIDSGGQYLDGTTDVTRTIAIGNPTNEQITHYSIVLKAHIAVASAVFPFSTTGGELDILARTHLWKFGIDYIHGTGHGVGNYLSVHEGPQAISKGNKVKLMPGMILSNEPGYYIPGKYGIRIENLMYVNKQKNCFLNFKQLTSIPYDRKLIDMQMLTKDEIKWINRYHQSVYENLENNINNKKWLEKICAPL